MVTIEEVGGEGELLVKLVLALRESLASMTFTATGCLDLGSVS